MFDPFFGRPAPVGRSSFIEIEAAVPQDVYQHTYANGLTLLAERMDHVRSAALNFLVPAGCIQDPAPTAGIGTIVAEMITRGAGSRDSEELSLALDNLGLDRSESVGLMHTRFWGATVSSNLPAALDLYADILLHPRLPEEELEPARALALQDLRSLEDEPRSLCLAALRKQHYPAPLSNDHRGTREGLEALTIDDVRAHYQNLFRPNGTILSVAGNVEWKPLVEQVGRLFGDWKPGTITTPSPGPLPEKRRHLTKETEQTQIAIAHASVPIGDPDFYAAQGAVSVLSGSMSSRLFTEIREKEGLCYAVWSSYQTLKDRASVISYAGTRNDRAQKTLDLLIRELRRLREGVEEEEVQRVQAGLKSALIMQQESTSARAGSLASDWYYLGRVRPFEEIQAAIDSLTPANITRHLERVPPGNFTIVTLGPQPLTIPA
jgi:predicted Zn-dependent peptidase